MASLERVERHWRQRSSKPAVRLGSRAQSVDEARRARSVALSAASCRASPFTYSSRTFIQWLVNPSVIWSSACATQTLTLNGPPSTAPSRPTRYNTFQFNKQKWACDARCSVKYWFVIHLMSIFVRHLTCFKNFFLWYID